MAAAGSPCWPSAAARAAEAALGSSEPSMLKVDSSSWSRAATVRSSREKDSDGFIPLGPAWTARVPMVLAVQGTASGVEMCGSRSPGASYVAVSPNVESLR